MIETILLIIGGLMILGLLFPRMYGQKTTRSVTVRVAGGMILCGWIILILLMNRIFFNDNQVDMESSSLVVAVDTVPELPMEVETPLVVVAVDTVPGLILDTKIKQVAVTIIGKLSALGVVLKINPTERIIYVDPTQWISITSEDRKAFCVMSAIYFTVVTDDEKLRVTIKNDYSGKVYAKLVSGVIFYY